MTQPVEAVGGASDTFVAAEPTLNDRMAAALGGEAEEKKPEEEDRPAASDGDVELTADDLGDGNEEGEPDDAPAIAPPVSWKDDEKEEFKQLPRALQETLARREAEREKFVQSKSQEAVQARQIVEREAISQVQAIAQQHAQHFQTLLPQVHPKPSPMMQVDDPVAYAEHMQAHEYSLAQHHQVQQAIHSAQAQANQAQQMLQQQERQEYHQRLSTDFPEFLDPTTGPKLRDQLGSTALALGYPAEVLPEATATDILAIRTATDWKAKADKYDALVAKRMETVRAAKGLPAISKPGVPQGKAARDNAAYARDREAMRHGDKDAAVRAISRFL